jgi:hypothetical protein
MRSRSTENKDDLAELLRWLLPSDLIFAKIKLHGNTKWLPRGLIFLALLWSWSETKQLTDAFDHALICYQSMFRSVAPMTYQGFMKAVAKWTPAFMNVVWPVLHERMKEIGGNFWRIDGWLPIAIDGSRSSAPRTIANEKALCAKKYGKGTTAKYRKKKSKGMRRKKNQRNKPHPQEPQAWITMMWHMGLRLPWMWQLGPSDSSERAHAMAMMNTRCFPEKTLFCADAGFVGYPLWATIVNNGQHFLIRVGGNVSLLSEYANYRVLANGIVLCWPKAMQSKAPPLWLRLVKVRIGKTRVYLLTSMLDPAQLTIQQMVKFYKLRWGIEVEFRGLKQTLDRAKLRCRNDVRLIAELHWSIMAMAIAELFALKVQLADRAKQRTRSVDPTRRSLAKTIRAIRGCLRDRHDIPKAGNDLLAKLAEAVTDRYQRKRSKRARYRPKNPDKKTLGEPKVRKLTPQEKIKLRQLDEKLAA